MKIGISYGCLELLKKNKIKEDSPKTLYLLTHRRCQNNCAFCSQARESKNNNLYLSRIIWPPIEYKELFSLLKDKKYHFKRICIQVTNSEFWKESIKDLILNLKNFDLPISLSTPLENLKELDELFGLGIDRINLSLDVADRGLFVKIKEKSWEDRIRLLKEASKRYKGKITTHIIVGLGEKERNLLEIIKELIREKIIIALFAFTPLPGTKLESRNPPDYLTYRKIQTVTYLLKENLINFEKLRFDDEDRLIIEDWWLNLSYPYFERIFLTTGCPDCNRPYYNETPRITPYNFSRPIRKEEIDRIKEILEKGKCSLNFTRI